MVQGPSHLCMPNLQKSNFADCKCLDILQRGSFQLAIWLNSQTNVTSSNCCFVLMEQEGMTLLPLFMLSSQQFNILSTTTINLTFTSFCGAKITIFHLFSFCSVWQTPFQTSESAIFSRLLVIVSFLGFLHIIICSTEFNLFIYFVFFLFFWDHN